jgi:hypothetical protein
MLIKINQDKAIEIAKDKIRVWRDKEFTKQDALFQIALEKNEDTSLIVAEKQRLRDLPNQCEGKNLDELKSLMSELGL